MTPSYIHRVMRKGGTTRWPSADYDCNQSSGSGKAVSLQPSLLMQGDMSMRKHLSLSLYQLCMRQRREADCGHN